MPRCKYKQEDFSIGALVRLAQWCKDSGRLALVVRKESYDRNYVWIQYIDDKGLSSEPSRATLGNLEIMNG
jgi:hypothetical protein